MDGEKLPPANAPQDDSSPLKKWMTKKAAMKYLDVGKTTFNTYRKLYGLVCSQVGNKLRVYEDDLHDFLKRYRK